MQNISNFRDAEASFGKIKPGMIYRSATLDMASQEDIKSIVFEKQIKTIIDLRGSGERIKSDDGASKLIDHYSKCFEPCDPKERKRYNVDLAGNLRSAVMDSVPWWALMVYMLLRVFGFKLYARQFLIPRSVLGKEGLLGLNKAFMQHASKDVKLIMDILSVKSSYPVIIHCSAGKDRTGFIVAIIQLLLGFSREEIVKDYAKSAALLKGVMGRIAMEVGKQGLSPEFAESPPRVMQGTLEYLERNFGSVSAYLQSIGVNTAQQEIIKGILSTETPKL